MQKDTNNGKKSPGSALLRWIRIALICVIAFEYFTLPSLSIEELKTKNVLMTALMEQRADEAAAGENVAGPVDAGLAVRAGEGAF